MFCILSYCTCWELCEQLWIFLESGSEIWDESDDEVISDIEPPPCASQNSDCVNNEDSRIKILVKWIVIFMSRLRVLFSLSDAASNFILNFFSAFFVLFGKIISPTNVFPEVPSSLYKMRRMLNGVKEFTRYIVCRKCSSVYKLEDCKDRNGRVRKCQFVLFPNHPQSRMRKPCDMLLLKSVELPSNKKILYPYLTYCYLSIETSLQAMLLRPSFLTECNKWRTRTVKNNVLQDI